MPEPPFELNATNTLEFKQQGWHLFRDLYEERLAGCALGDVFAIEGNRTLDFNYSIFSGLETHSEGGSVLLFPGYDTGLNLNEAGLGLEVKQLGLSIGASVGTLIVTIAAAAPAGTIGYSNGVMSGGEYSFYPLVYKYTQAFCNSLIAMAYVASLGSYATNIGLGIQKTHGPPYEAGATFYVGNNYVTSSGEVYWIFIKRNKSTGEIKGKYFSHDHPCFGNGNDPLLVQHPFGEVKDDEEVIVINPTEEQVKKLKHLCRPQKIGDREKSLLEFIGEGRAFDIGKEERKYPKKKVTVGIVEDEDMRPLWHKETAKITKCIIPQPDYVKVRNLVENGNN